MTSDVLLEALRIWKYQLYLTDLWEKLNPSVVLENLRIWGTLDGHEVYNVYNTGLF